MSLLHAAGGCTSDQAEVPSRSGTEVENPTTMITTAPIRGPLVVDQLGLLTDWGFIQDPPGVDTATNAALRQIDDRTIAVWWSGLACEDDPLLTIQSIGVIVLEIDRDTTNNSGGSAGCALAEVFREFHLTFDDEVDADDFEFEVIEPSNPSG